MDAFFASVEEREQPHLKGKPVIVGGPSMRGVVCAASYPARVFGVRSAMPLVEALRRCPTAYVMSPRHSLYGEVSRKIFSIFARYTPLVEGLSMDEAFLDVSGCYRLFGDGVTIARDIKEAIWREERLRASAGVASNKFVAKIASDLDKPDGLVEVKSSEVNSFLSDLPIEKMWGVGPVAGKRLRELGYKSIGDLARSDPARLERCFGKWGRQVYLLALGQDPREVKPSGRQKSLGAEVTFEEDISCEKILARHLFKQVSRVATRLNKTGLAGRVVTVKVKDSEFISNSARVKIESPLYDTDSLWEVASGLLHRLIKGNRRFRLVGVSVSELTDGEIQRSLFTNEVKGQRENLQNLSDSINERFGGGGIVRGSLLED